MCNFSHHMADMVVHGKATSNASPIEQGEGTRGSVDDFPHVSMLHAKWFGGHVLCLFSALTNLSKTCGEESLVLLGHIKSGLLCCLILPSVGGTRDSAACLPSCVTLTSVATLGGCVADVERFLFARRRVGAAGPVGEAVRLHPAPRGAGRGAAAQGGGRQGGEHGRPHRPGDGGDAEGHRVRVKALRREFI